MGIIQWILGLLKKLSSPYREAEDMPSPRVPIVWGDIHYDRDAKRLIVEGIEPEVVINTVADTGSMEPLIDAGHIVVRSTSPKYKDNLWVGSIIVYRNETGALVIHSIIYIGADASGWYCETKGLNCNYADGLKVRKENIQDVALAVFWCKEGSEEGD